MYKNGRDADGNFRRCHGLYLRCQNEDVVGNRLLPARIRYFDVSVNWSKYSWPWDVIFGYPGSGIVRFVVRDLPKELPKDKPADKSLKLLSFRPIHAPETDNYAHAEICVFAGDVRVLKQKAVGEMAKKEFRQIMSDRGLLLLPPTS